MSAKQIYKALYVAGAATVLTFVVGLAFVALAEAYGPSDSQPGRVIDRSDSEYTQSRCTPGAGCRTVTFQAYTVTGEREDGTTWIVTGQGPYDAMQGERGEIRVATSTVTGRVVALRGTGARDFWGVRGSSFVIFAIGALVVGVGLFVLFEWSRRRSGNWGWGNFSVRLLAAALPGVLLGALGLWYVTWQPTQGLEAISSQERYGDLLQDPLATIAAQEPDDLADGAIAPGMPFGDFGASVLVPSYTQLTTDYQSRIDALDYIAIPVALRNKFGPPANVVVRGTDSTGTLYDPIDCTTGERDATASRIGIATQVEPIGVDREVRATIVCLPNEASGPVEIVFGTSLPKVFRITLDQLQG